MDRRGNIVQSGPTKDFFISMITRDISLTDAIIELIDNCIDGVKRQGKEDFDNYTIDIELNSNFFSIKDNCGGIDINIAREYAFKFGRPKEANKDENRAETTGTFGIGMKRALFKMGSHFFIESTALNSWFKLEIDVPVWASDDDNWDFEFTDYKEGIENKEPDCGTYIKVTNLYPSISNSFSYNPYINEVINKVKGRASYVINNGMTIKINNVKVESNFLKLVNDGFIKPYKYTFTNDNVAVIIVAGLAPDTDPAQAGWYIYCNNREIVAADKTSLTTWKDRDDDESIKYHNDYAAFRGFVFFNSKFPELLPWNTSKNGIDSSAYIYQTTKQHMIDAFKTVTGEIKKLYSKDDELRSEILSTLKKSNNIELNYYTAYSLPENTVVKFVDDYTRDVQKDPEVRISYLKPKSQVEAIKQKLDVKSNKDVGVLTFEYYVEMEGLE